MREDEDAGHAQRCPEDDRSKFWEVETMDVTGFKQDRGGNMHEDPDDKRHEFASVVGQSRV